LLKALEPVPVQYNAVIWNLVRVLALLEEADTRKGQPPALPPTEDHPTP
jgi:hypothetical protein